MNMLKNTNKTTTVSYRNFPVELKERLKALKTKDRTVEQALIQVVRAGLAVMESGDFLIPLNVEAVEDLRWGDEVGELVYEPFELGVGDE